MSGDRFNINNITALTRIDDLIDENRLLRDTLRQVSSAGIVMMHRSHPQECASFTTDFMRSVIEIAEGIKITEVGDIFSSGFELATQPSPCSSVPNSGDKH